MRTSNVNPGYAHLMAQARVNANGAPDIFDVRNIANAYHSDSRSRKIADEMSRDRESAIASVGGRRERMMRGELGMHGANMGAAGGGCDTRGSAEVLTRDGRAVPYNDRVPHYPADPACQFPSDCGGDLLGFNTLTVAAFPIGVPAPGAVISQGTINIGSQTADKFKPRYLFWEGRDVSQGFAVVPSLLVSSFVGPAQQTIGSGPFNSITSAVFALTNTPLPIGWDAFRNIEGQTLVINFGNFLPAVGTSVQFFGCIWGDAGVMGY